MQHQQQILSRSDCHLHIVPDLATMSVHENLSFLAIPLSFQCAEPLELPSQETAAALPQLERTGRGK